MSSPDWENALHLEQGESITASWRGEHSEEVKRIRKIGNVMPPRTAGEKIFTIQHGDDLSTYKTVTETAEVERKGILVLTNKRLVWLSQSGILHKSYLQELGIRLDAVRGMSLDEKSKSVSITDDQGDWSFKLQGLETEEQFKDFKQAVKP